MVDINKIIDEILLEHSLTYPFPSLEDKEQVENLIRCCHKLGYSQYSDIISEYFLLEEEPKKPASVDKSKEGESSEFPGKFHLGGGYYSSKQNGEAEFKNDSGNLRPVTPEEKADFEKKSQPSSDSEKKPPITRNVGMGYTKKSLVDVPKQKFQQINQKIEKWSEKEKEFFNKGQEKPGSETRRSFAEALKDKVKGAGAAIKHGFQHEVKLFKTAAGAAGKLFSKPGGWRDLEKDEKKALISVGVKIATTAITGAALGGAAAGAKAFAKHVAIEFIPHVVAETIAVGAARASIFADVNNDERILMDFADKIAEKLENMEISPEIMDKIVDSWNEKRPQEEVSNETISLDEILNYHLLKEDEGESSQFPGKYHLGGGFYSSKQGGEAEFKNDGGSLRPITPEEKEEFEGKGIGDSEVDKLVKTAEDSLEKKEKEIEDETKPDPKTDFDKILDDPSATAKERAMAGSFKNQHDNLKRKQKDDPEYQSKLKKEVVKQNEDIVNSLRGEKDSDGNNLDAEVTENGSMLIGVEHGEGTESTKNIIDKIKSLPKDAKVMFVGEGGVGIDDNGKVDFVGEQAEIRDAFLDHFENGREESWDENGDVRNSDAPIFDEIAKSYDGDKNKALASVWTNMIGQGDDLDADDYLTDDTKEWIKSEAKKGGSAEFEGDVDWNNLTLEQKEDLYQLNYRDDQNYGETELSKGQKAFNDFRQKELDRKIKEAEEKGYTVIATMGNSHVGMWRERNKKSDDKFNPSSLRNLAKEMPDVDKDVFNKESDLDKIPSDKREEISMKIDELADKASKGEDFNLCQITVPGTNLYCDDNQGISRVEMPQFKGKPLPGTPAEDLPKDSKGEVDTEPLFKKMLKEKGIKTVETELPSDKLKATQSELVGSKVAGMTKALEEDPTNPGITAPIFVSRDGFVIDGHHRWAAVTSAAIKAGKPANMKVIVVDMDIKDAIPMCNQFAEEQGIAAKKADSNDGELPKPKKADETPNQRVYNVGGNYYSDTPNGPAQYIKTESVVQKIFIEEDVNFFHLIFEAVVTKVDADGNPIKLTVIEPKDQPEATQKADQEDKGSEQSSNVTSIKGDWKNKALQQMSKEKYKDSILDDNLKENISNIVDKMLSGADLTDEEKVIAKDYIKIVKTDSKVKLYIASKTKGDWSQQGYIKVEIGSGNAAKKWADEASGKYDVTSGASSQGVFGKKQNSPAKLNDKRKKAKIEEIDENTIMFHGKKMTKLPVLTFDEIKSQLKSENPNLDEKELNKKAAILERRIKRYNDNIDAFKEVIREGGGEFEYVDFGDVDTPENRGKAIQNMVDIALENFKTKLGEKANIEENKVVLDTLEKLKKFEGINLETDEEARKEYEQALSDLIVHMTNSKDFRDGVADFAEYKVAMELLGRGYPTYLPSDEAFKTADVLVVNSAELSDLSDKSKALQLLYVTLEFSGGISVKYQGGGAGNSDEKVKKTRFKNNETRRRLNGMLATYDTMYPDSRTPPNFPPSQESLDELNATHEDNKKWAIESGIATEQEIKKAEDWADKRIEAVLKTFTSNGVMDCMNDDEKARFKETMRSYYRNQKLMEVIYNNDADYTLFGNSNQKIKVSKGKAIANESDVADGVQEICYMKIKDDVGFAYTKQGDCTVVKPSNRNPSEIHSHKPSIK